MITFVSYLLAVPVGEKNFHKKNILIQFTRGVSNVGDTAVAHMGFNLLPSKVAFIQGWVHEDSPDSKHLKLRKHIIEFQKQNNGHVLVADSNLFNYRDPDKLKSYIRYSFDGIFPNTGNYFCDNPNPARWQSISKNLNLRLSPWRTSGNHILICTQRNGGWSMKGLHVVDWLEQIISEIRLYSDRPIIIRPHPGDKLARAYLNNTRFSHTISTNKCIVQDLQNAHAVITYNSSPAVVAAIEGIPVFVTDPEPVYSQAYDIANTDLKTLETPLMPDRQSWIEKISMCHWNTDEIASGEAWRHIKNYI